MYILNSWKWLIFSKLYGIDAFILYNLHKRNPMYKKSIEIKYKNLNKWKKLIKLNYIQRQNFTYIWILLILIINLTPMLMLFYITPVYITAEHKYTLLIIEYNINKQIWSEKREHSSIIEGTRTYICTYVYVYVVGCTPLSLIQGHLRATMVGEELMRWGTRTFEGNYGRRKVHEMCQLEVENNVFRYTYRCIHMYIHILHVC